MDFDHRCYWIYRKFVTFLYRFGSITCRQRAIKVNVMYIMLYTSISVPESQVLYNACTKAMKYVTYREKLPCIVFLCYLIRWVQVFCLIVDSSVGLWECIQFAGDMLSQASQLRILHSAEEDNFSFFDSKIACMCIPDVMSVVQSSCGHVTGIVCLTHF